jgi:hypothetical protein
MPSKRKHSDEDLARVGFWGTGKVRQMDESFVQAMVEAGYQVTSSSSHFGTRTPRAGYERPDRFTKP